MDEAATYDLIVIGAGMAGHCAALEAARLGARVVLLEKTGTFGGSTRMCGGAFAFAGTDVQHRNGIEDSPERLAEDLLKAGKHRNDRSLIETYAARQLDAYQWLRGLGLVFEKVSLSGAQSVPRNHSIDPVLVLDTLHDAVLAAGVGYRPMAHVRSLIKDQEGCDAVVGVELIDDARVLAGRGVVIATGGFSRSADMVERFAPHLRSARPMGGYGNTGDGLRMAWALGADLVDMGYVKGTFGAPAWYGKQKEVDEERAPRLISAMYRGAIVVNQAGKRFCDESISYKEIGELCLRQEHARGFQIFDQQVMDQSSELPTVANFKAAHRAGLFVEAPSIDALARALDIDPFALSETVRSYNEACDGNRPDEFGRTSLSTGYGRPTRIDQGPFLGYACTTGLTSTYRGLLVDTDARVLNVFGHPIAGLYAAGEVMGGFHGETYMSGSSLAKGCIFGRLAAQHAVGRVGDASLTR